RRRVPVAAPDRGGVELHQLEPTSAVRSLHHRVLHPDALEPHHAVPQPPSTCPSPCRLSPSSPKNAVAASRSSTTMPTCSMRWIVMRSTQRNDGPSYSVFRLSIGWCANVPRTTEQPGVPRGGVKLLERMIEVSGVDLCTEAF